MRGSTYIGDAWHGWFHVVGNTYGTWVRGDERGFRTRHHREHVDGDYKNPPPPGVYDALRYCSERAMGGREPVVLTWEARVAACLKFAEALRFHHIELLNLAITARHYHFVARFPCTEQWIELITRNLRPTEAHGLQSVGFSSVGFLPAHLRSVGHHRHDRRRRKSALDDPPRHYTGIAKKESARALSAAGLGPPGGVWGKRCIPIPIEHRGHQLHAVKYVGDHRDEGGAVLSDLERT